MMHSTTTTKAWDTTASFVHNPHPNPNLQFITVDKKSASRRLKKRPSYHPDGRNCKKLLFSSTSSREIRHHAGLFLSPPSPFHFPLVDMSTHRGTVRTKMAEQACSATTHHGGNRSKQYKASAFPTARHLSPGGRGQDEKDNDTIRSSKKETEFDNGSNNIMDKAVSIITKVLIYPVPIPFLPPFEASTLPFVYPLLLLGGFAVLSLSTSLLLSVFFFVYLTLGRYVASSDGVDDYDVDMDEEVIWDDSSSGNNNNALDLAALVGSIASAGLLSPSGLGVRKDDVAVISVSASTGLILGSVVVAFVVVAVMSNVTGVATQNSPKGSFGGDDDDDDNEDPSSADDASRRLLELWDDKFAQVDQSSQRPQLFNENETKGKENQQ
mmetsp:Transcript_15122/g.20591  ORF Transcript_15122/g.20591 Transcript_15122/m.20591 type:complete len:382 (-) Transcript_15122:366-1511(-)